MRRPVTPFQKAVELLGRRSHFRRELDNKLRKRGFDDAEVEETLARLEERSLIDDRATGEEFVRGRLARKPLGRVRLISELRARGVDSGTVREVLDELYPEDDLDLARTAALSRPRASRAALARYLERRGFTARAIVSVLKERDTHEDHEQDPL